MQIKLTLKIVLAVSVLVVGALFILHINLNPKLPEKSPSQKGVDWFINQQNIMDPELAVNDYKKMYKVASDNETANKLLELVKIEESKINKTKVEINEKDSKYKDWLNIEQTAVDLLNEQCLGKENAPEVDKLKNIFLARKNDMEAAIPVNSSSVITALYFLGKLGIFDENLLTKTIGNQEKSAVNLNEHLYGITHVIFTNSGYYDRYLNPADFPKETEILETLLSEYNMEEKIDISEVDRLSEVVFALKLLGLGSIKNIVPINIKIASLQNKDGSWGINDEPYENKVHRTLVATLALMDFAKNFRQSDVFCLSK